ncbi:hypothetical protein ASD19_09805 [Microbacterium sp. Root53]|uniref:AAA family ATPase n=1 Tax=Microbacterium sp. Root53 TaxID=1736553 RepID=UPI0006FCF58E|nr:AAA family ATPase [Microbacterium sp. Root53]KQY96834.1 hypothetical protein ASD19_09805 [Microbacterium sp. Root53]
MDENDITPARQSNDPFADCTSPLEQNPEPAAEVIDLAQAARRRAAGRRPAEAKEIAGQLLRVTPPIVAVVGKPGIGRTSLLREVESLLLGLKDVPLVSWFRPDTDRPSDELQRDLDFLNSTDGWRAREVLVIDDLDTVARLGTRGPDVILLEQISLAHHRDRICFLVSIDEKQLERLADVHEELASSLHKIRLSELAMSDLRSVVMAAGETLASRAGVALGAGVVDSVLAPAGLVEPRAHPGLALDRIDAAIGRARIQRQTSVTVGHVQADPTRSVALVDRARSATADELAQQLREGVRGQDLAIETFAGRLAPAFAGLKLRPERPQGVFLFAGPSGVGKTELARQTAQVAYGSTDALIRLDMSEYGNGQDGRVKLIGAHRSWKNSSTDGLLTTRVIANPRSVVLLDEFEKSSPEIWPLFLQVFDEGRLSDGWDQTASFAETTIVLTSNLGVREGATRTAGFGAGGGFSTGKQLDAVTRALPPELMNRITAVIPFAPLTEDTIRELAHLELGRAARRFAEKGWLIEWDDDLTEWLARAGYDPAYGARHLQRAIEREVFPLVARSPRITIRIEVGPGGPVVTPTG